MDPLVAAFNHNRENLLVAKLPVELGLHIVRFIEPADAICLRRASRRLRQLVDAGFGTRGQETEQILIQEKDGCVRESCSALNSRDHAALRERLGLIKPKGLYDRDEARLCEHYAVPWGHIENHIKAWRLYGPDRNWERCCRNFLPVVCRYPEHDRRCSPDQEPTCPQGRLVVGSKEKGQDPDKIYFSMEWTLHHGFMSGPVSLLPLRNCLNGRISSLKLRSLVQQGRKDGGEHLLPARRPNFVPEMACFAPGTERCNCVHYDGAEDARHADSGPLPRTLDSLIKSCPTKKHEFVRSPPTRYGHRDDREGVSFSSHIPNQTAGFSHPQDCLVVRYFRDLVICNKDTMRQTFYE